MKIGIDARFFSESGVGRYLRNLIENLKVLDKSNQYFIFLLPKDIKQFNQTKNFKKVEADFKWYGFAEQFNFPKLLKKYSLDLAHFPHFNVPIFYQGKFVVTIHDLIHQHHSMSRATTLNPFAFKIKQIGYKKVFKSAAINSEKILVPSKSVKQLLTLEWKIQMEKIIVTEEAADDKLITIARKISKQRSEEILKKFKIMKPYLFYVGNAHPHKNVEGLINAFLKLKKKYVDLKLVLSGNDHYFWQRISKLVADAIRKDQSYEEIIFTGFITDEELAVIYQHASLFVLPSFEEGFGIPILEAMALNCPVAASNTASLSEVGGKACLYFNPQDVSDMQDKIEKILEDEDLRSKLIEMGQKRVKLFSWKRLAEKTLEVYQKCELP